MRNWKKGIQSLLHRSKLIMIFKKKKKYSLDQKDGTDLPLKYYLQFIISR